MTLPMEPCPRGETFSDKVFQSVLEYPSGKIFLTDSLLTENLSEEERFEICRDDAKSGYYFNPQTWELLRKKLDPQNLRLPLSSLTNDEEEIIAALEKYEKTPPPIVTAKNFETNRFILTSLSLSPEEAALIRHAMDDFSDPPDASFLRRVANPFHSDDAAAAHYAFSVDITATQYDKILAYLSFFDGADAQSVTHARAKLLANEIGELKSQLANKNSAARPILIPESFYENANIALWTIAHYQQSPPLPLDPPKADGYILFRQDLFPEEVAFLRYVLDDPSNTAFKSYFQMQPVSKARPYYIQRNSNWGRLIDSLQVLKNICEREHRDEGEIIRVAQLKREAERLQQKARDESKWFQFWQHGMPIALAFTAAGAGLGLIAKGPVFLRWLAEKIRNSGGPKPPASPTDGSDRTTSSRSPLHVAKILGWGLATIGAGALTIAAGAATLATAEIPGVDVATGASTYYAAGLTATAATAFYLSCQNWINSFFETE